MSLVGNNFSKRDVNIKIHTNTLTCINYGFDKLMKEIAKRVAREKNGCKLNVYFSRCKLKTRWRYENHSYCTSVI